MIFAANSFVLHEYDATWDRFYGPNPSPDKFYNKVYNNSTFINETGNIFILYAIFHDFSPNGVIWVSRSPSDKVLTSKTFFSNSNSTKDGGSIYVNSGSCIQYRVCSINSSSNFGAHSYVLTNGQSYNIECSLSKCAGLDSSLDLEYGDQIIDSTNISYANCNFNAAYWCNAPYINHVKFTSVFNNTAVSQSIMFHMEVFDHYISHCNVIQNTFNDNNYGILQCIFCDFEISFCVFSSNSGPCVIYNSENQWFRIDNCFFDNDINKTLKVSKENTTTNYLVLKLRHLSTQECFAEYPLLSPHEETKSYNTEIFDLFCHVFVSTHLE